MAKAIATEASVFEAADELTANGVEPSMINVQQRVGGSYTTIKRLLGLWQEHRTAAPVVAVPPELAGLGDEWLRRVWGLAMELARHETQAIREQAQSQTEQLRRELDEATGELERLEQVEVEQTQELETVHNSLHALELRCVGLEAQAARVEALEREAVAAGELRQVLERLQAQVAALSPPQDESATRGAAKRGQHGKKAVG